MSASTAKLDQSLDTIMKDTRSTNRGSTRARRSRNPKGRVTRTTRVTKMVAPANAANANSSKNLKASKKTLSTKVPSESKIIVSGLTPDIDEKLIKEYFAETIGPIKQCIAAYGPGGTRRGVFTVVFNSPNAAAEAVAKTNGLKVDSKTMKVEVVLSANQAPTPAPVKSISERVIKTQGKPAKTGTRPARGKVGRGGARGGKALGRARGKPKTIEQLDAEMTDYFGEPNGAQDINEAIQPATNGEAAVEDEIM